MNPQGHSVDDLVRHKQPFIHDALDASGKFGMVLRVPTKDVSNRDMNEVVVLAEKLCLRTFSRALRTDDDVFVHGNNNVLLKEFPMAGTLSQLAPAA